MNGSKTEVLLYIIARMMYTVILRHYLNINYISGETMEQINNMLIKIEDSE